MADKRSSLRRRILLGLLAFTALLTVAVVAQGIIVNEHVERLVWQTLLESELDHFGERSRVDPNYHWTDTASIKLYDSRESARVPVELRGLPPGVHDEVLVGGVEHVALVRDIDGRRVVLSLDISDLEAREFDMTLTIAGAAITTLVMLSLLIALGVDRLMQPLSTLAERIARLRPDQSGQRIDVPHAASAELVVIADSLNDYLQRNERFVERERAFIDSASHELRTPIAVIVGATELALDQPDLPAPVRHQLGRIRRTSQDVERLISLLLALAKDPARLARASDRVALDQLLPEIVDDHRQLTRDKHLRLTLAPLPACEIVAPLPIVQAAIGNLLRNAIEHSDRGEILIRLQAPATVIIDDPGHGMSPEEISAIYARIARGGGDRDGGGIGLDLISRLCEHLGWTLSFESDVGRGTRTTLVLGGQGDATRA
ncbi:MULTISPECIES: HAMP domain-containing sensor histidine kinase [unclassified Lysobacter]|uniref:sensor histidine kinase n=1 Tax=unclassified Lysobacter TaxID=2635362 RepID=UPI0006F71866|nr:MULTISPECIES: HAMP domain-containing sensor histidine kinase [unclassified Lysobacter]KRA17299.1 histidine kinase [Lysobacter sp. Root604]KRD34605.1 histidine kinase [Lysobacter sp. Root916]KRD76984.1 histidine kinase [Lysobacter sp. Root983]